jgi:hypothetical protein
MLSPNLESEDFRDVKLAKVDLARARLDYANLRGVDLRGANLGGATLFGTDLRGATLDGACLAEADLDGAFLTHASLRHADLTGASAFGAAMGETDLTGATLVCAYLEGTDLSGAVLADANLRKAILRETNMSGATLVRCNVYGTACWDVRLDRSIQENLCVTPEGTPAITVDSIELAQFIYLLLNNKQLRTVIDTITSKAVLILGRFTGERKSVLGAIHKTLREQYGLAPILFDFAPPRYKDLTETVQLLAGMCRFVVADLTDARSIPQELSHIVPNFPSVPVQPIILRSQRAYAMFEHWRRFSNVLPEYRYRDGEHLTANFESAVIRPVERWRRRSARPSRQRAPGRAP